MDHQTCVVVLVWVDGSGFEVYMGAALYYL